jgi:predicted RNA-binding Zn-ribbon protein involved in translation (DUF1610 family)
MESYIKILEAKLLDDTLTREEIVRIMKLVSVLSLEKEELETETEETQPCSNCLKDVPHNSRYPEYICKDCQNKEIRDANGTLVEFCNKGFGGGLLVIYYDENKQVIREDTSFSKFECYLDGKPFIASEAKFGGIVIQKKD